MKVRQIGNYKMIGMDKGLCCSIERREKKQEVVGRRPCPKDIEMTREKIGALEIIGS
jgi:hypothetical protein